jgi:hypothetical protein
MREEWEAHTKRSGMWADHIGPMAHGAEGALYEDQHQ